MKKLATLVSALALAGSLAFAQTAGDKTQEGPKKTTKTGVTMSTKAKKHHKGGKKHKKGSGSATSGSAVPK
jgi:hypothetical protein